MSFLRFRGFGLRVLGCEGKDLRALGFEFQGPGLNLAGFRSYRDPEPAVLDLEGLRLNFKLLGLYLLGYEYWRVTQYVIGFGRLRFKGCFAHVLLEAA